jgi:hypothetical protein
LIGALARSSVGDGAGGGPDLGIHPTGDSAVPLNPWGTSRRGIQPPRWLTPQRHIGRRTVQAAGQRHRQTGRGRPVTFLPGPRGAPDARAPNATLGLLGGDAGSGPVRCAPGRRGTGSGSTDSADSSGGCTAGRRGGIGGPGSSAQSRSAVSVQPRFRFADTRRPRRGIAQRAHASQVAMPRRRPQISSRRDRSSRGYDTSNRPVGRGESPVTTHCSIDTGDTPPGRPAINCSNACSTILPA